MRSFSYVDDVLDDLVPPVVARYREAGTLTWSLLHRIEGEVLEEALASGQLSAATVKMIRSHEAFLYPKDDRPASFVGHEVMPVVFGAIEDAWNRLH
jgi:hypothetical protein